MSRSTARPPVAAPPAWPRALAVVVVPGALAAVGLAGHSAHEAATSTSGLAELGFLVAGVLAVPALPAAVLAVAALRAGDRHRARTLALWAAGVLALVPLTWTYLGLG